MSIGTILYNLIIGPLELFFEILFSMADRIIQNPGVSIIFLSLAMNFLVLPLYKRADALQEEERETEARLRPWVTHIKKTFKGDERFMMLQTYYRQNNYKQTDILKGSVSLLLEIPFFIAAYNFLSGLELLNGVSFGPIADLGAPDGMLVLGGHAINVLPVLMTLINLVSSAIYTKGSSLKSKIQLYGMAGIFLVLLYQSPAGLVFYWTLNNLFSLVKNVFYKLKNPVKVLGILSAVCGWTILAVIWFIHPVSTIKRGLLLTVFCAALQCPVILYYVKKHRAESGNEVVPSNGKNAFWVSAIFLTIFTGMLIPSALLNSSPEEFINKVTHISPLSYVVSSTLTAVGIFIIWCGIFYMLANAAGKRLMGYILSSVSVVAVINYMFFGRNMGTMNAELVFNKGLSISIKDEWISVAVLVAVFAVMYIISRKKKEIVRAALGAAVLAALGMSVINLNNVRTVTIDKIEQMQQVKENQTHIPLSKEGKNVMVIMMDRAISSYYPYIMDQVDGLEQQFEGFTYYPNTISYGAYTNFGSPGLYGGYDYIPEEMNRRKDEKLEEKHNEALKVMPVLFDQAGYHSTVCDPTYAGYDWIPDLSIYDEYPNIDKYITMGNFDRRDTGVAKMIDTNMERDLFCYSLFKAAPAFCQNVLYDNGNYNSTDNIEDEIELNIPEGGTATATFMNSYAVLESLPEITTVEESKQGTFMMISNDSTHDPCILWDHDYVNDNVRTLNGRVMHMDTEDQVMHYQANMVSYIQLGKWFDFMRENDVYDNTRIIIVSDHGASMKQFDDMMFGSEHYEDAMFFNPILLVKDFNADKRTTDMTFMTNADVPTIAMSGLINDPVNPFTGHPINSDRKKDPEQMIFYSGLWDVSKNNGNEFLPGTWLSVHDNIFNLDNWKVLEK